MRRTTTAALTALTAAAAALAAVVTVALVRAPSAPVPAPPSAGAPSPAPAPAAVLRADAPWGSISGRVTDIDANPLAGVQVVAQDLHGFGGLARTEADGSFRLDLAPCSHIEPDVAHQGWPDQGWPGVPAPGATIDVLVAARADGFTRSNTRRVSARRGEDAPVGALVLYRGGRIEGRVVDPDGREVPARVRVLSLDSKDAVAGMQALPDPFPAGWSAAVPGAGFALGPVGPGTVELWATAPGVGTAHGTVVVGEAQTVRVDLPVVPEQHIAGRVVDAAGVPVPECRVVCRPEVERVDGRVPKVRTGKRAAEEAPGPPDARAPPGRPLATDTDADGRFWFYTLDADSTYRVSVAGTDQAETGVAPGRSNILLVVPARTAVRGTVRDSVTGAPVAGAAVLRLDEGLRSRLLLVRPLGLTPRGTPDATTADDGSFTLPRVFPGSFALVVSRPGYEVAETPVTVGTSPSPPVDVALDPAARVLGRVTDPSGAPAAGTRLTLAPAPPRATPGQPLPLRARGPWTGRLFARSDADGAFELAGVPGDTDLVLRASDAQGRSYREPLRLARSEARNVSVRLADPATVSVRVRPATTGARDGHPVRLVGVDDTDVQLGAETGADGVARIEHLPPGRYRLLATDPNEDAQRPGVASRIQQLDLLPGARFEAEIEIPDITVVSGTVTEDGVAARAARIGFGPLRGTPDHYRPLLFEVREGRYTGRVPPGEYHVHVLVPGRRTELEAPVAVPAAPTHRLDVDVPAR